MSTDVPSHFWSNLQGKLRIAWIVIAIVFAFTASSSASSSPSASVIDVVIDVVIGVDEELQFYTESGDRIGHTLTIDGCGEPSMLVFETTARESWQLDVISLSPSTVMACSRSEDAIECWYDGSTEVELILQATSLQTTDRKRKPLIIVAAPTTMPAPDSK